MNSGVPDPTLTRRDVLKGGSGLAAATALSAIAPRAAGAQTPKRGGTLRTSVIADPVTGFDPHQTISFLTMVPLSFAYSRLVKVKAGPDVKPMTYPVEPDLAESWTRANDTTYVFRLKKGVRWHPKPPVNGRELTSEDVKYTYDRFLGIKGNGNRPVLESIDRIETPDKYTVRFILREPNAWFIDNLASTSTWIIARECVEKFGDLKKAESVVGTGPWMLEKWEPNVRLTYVRNPSYFVPGLPYADAVDVLIDKDPSSRLAAFLAGQLDFAPEYQHVIRRLDLAIAKQRRPNLQTAEFAWFTSGSTGFKIDKPPFNDVRVRRALSRAVNLAEIFESNAFSQGSWVPNPAVPAASAEWSIPIDQLGPEGRRLYEHSTADAKRLLAEAGHPNGFKTEVEAPGTGYGPDFLDFVQIAVKNWKAAGIDADLKLKEYGAFISSTIYGKFDHMFVGLRGAWTDPEAYFYRWFMPGQPLNVWNVNDSKLTDMIKLQRRTFDVAKRRQIVFDIQRYLAEQAYFGADGSVKVVCAWEPHIKNFMPNNGFDYGGRLMAAWIDK
ncbi:MAG TPA: ABC transporter substrate-binding protein [Methylomirabilota bacterium]|jgi:peptide/nickel transport system substrate-binding protein|nr:ABC transporter substrate-binding protein [Methylomirabilota bacterium]